MRSLVSDTANLQNFIPVHERVLALKGEGLISKIRSGKFEFAFQIVDFLVFGIGNINPVQLSGRGLEVGNVFMRLTRKNIFIHINIIL